MKEKLPHDYNAEAAFLSAMMLSAENISKAIDLVDETDFHKTKHRLLFNVLTEMFQKNIAIDLITIIDYCKKKKVLSKIGEVWLNNVSDMVTSGANMQDHARIIKDKALLRKLILKSHEFIRIAESTEVDTEELLKTAENSIIELTDKKVRNNVKKIDEIVPDTIRHIEAMQVSGKDETALQTGLTDLDEKIGGLYPGQLIILASRPSHGKSSLALNIAKFNTFRNDKTVLFFSLEMDARENTIKLLSDVSSVNSEKIIKGYKLSEEEILKLTDGADVLQTKEIYIDDTPGLTHFQIKATSRRLASKVGKIDLIVIDYLQLMQTAKENREQGVAEISRNLKILAKELNCPVLALSQLNREVDKTENKIPRLHHLRESGAIEQDADVVIFLMRPIVYRLKTIDVNGEKLEVTEDMAVFHIAKNRHGRTGLILASFRKEFTRFVNRAEY